MAHLGVDLVINALYSSRIKLDKSEYRSVIVVTLVVSYYGFVTGSIADIYVF